jgi:hypothetical protein
VIYRRGTCKLEHPVKDKAALEKRKWWPQHSLCQSRGVCQDALRVYSVHSTVNGARFHRQSMQGRSKPIPSSSFFISQSRNPLILWNAKVHCRSHASPPLVSTLSHINSVYALPSDFSKILFNTTFSVTYRSSKCSPSFRVPHQNPLWTSSLTHTCHMSHSSHSSWFF